MCSGTRVIALSFRYFQRYCRGTNKSLPDMAINRQTSYHSKIAAVIGKANIALEALLKKLLAQEILQ